MTSDPLEIKNILEELESVIKSPKTGLPEDIFLFISRITPLVNVDLLIKSQQKHTLLSWRDDGYYRPGWHVPGGIIRFKETIADRIYAVAKNEFGAEVEFNQTPLAFNEVILPEMKNRGHFISFLYECRLVTQPLESLRCKDNSPNHNEWMWHAACPENIIPVHEMYRRYISNIIE